MAKIALAALLLAVAVAGSAAAKVVHDPGLERAGLVNVLERDESIQLDLRYATAENFTGARLPGYCQPLAYLRRRAARALARVQRSLVDDGLGLLVFDAYRPARASRAMVSWARRTGRGHLVGTYIASRSNHNRGVAVDLTLVRRSSGRALDMGGGYDSFSTRSHTTNASGKPLRNRLRLRSAMHAQGFRNYRREWWHYDYAGDPRAPSLDLTIGC